MIRRLTILLLIVGCVFVQDKLMPILHRKISIDKKEELKDNQMDTTYHSSIFADSLKINPRNFLG